MQAMAAPALPSSVPSPHPATPWFVSILTKTYGRSEVAGQGYAENLHPRDLDARLKR